jgi:hypothetical protein
MAYFPGDVNEFEIQQFQGSAQASDPYSLDQNHGLYSQNIDFIVSPSGLVQATPRRGTSQIVQIPSGDHAVTSLAPWYFNNGGVQDCYAVYYAPSVGAKAWSQQAANFVSLVPVTGAKSLSFVPDGVRGYFAFCDASGRVGTTSGYVYGLSYAAADQLFGPPVQSTVVTIVVDTTHGSGVVTAGNHRLGIVFTTRSGYTGALSLVDSNGVFAPITAMAPDGVHEWGILVTFVSVPAYLSGGTFQIVLTSSSNPAEYYLVPGAIGNVPASPSFVEVIVSITDGDLVTGTNVTENQNLLTASQSGAPPFLPSAIFAYSSRLGYVAIDSAGFPVVYISDQNDYQYLTAGFHAIYLEGRQIPIQGVSIDTTLFIATLSGLYSCSDNGGQPVTWTPPGRVDGSVGVLAPSCILSNNGRILLASEKGLFSYTNGNFPTIPLSYWQAPDWNRINWNAPTQVQVVDDALDRIIRVIAPLKVLVTSASNTNPITVITGVLVNGQVVAEPHFLTTGMSVTIVGVGGNTAANTAAVVTVTGPSTFTIPVAGNGAYTSGGVVTPNEPTAEMAWNYSDGETPGMPYSINGFSAFRRTAVGVIRNIATGYDEVWYGPGASNPGGIVRRVLPTDALIHRDVDMSGNPTAIVSLLETGICPGAADLNATLHDYAGAHFRVYGSGALVLTAFGLDHAVSVTPAASPLTLASKPGTEVLVKWSLRSEQQTILLAMSTVDAFYILSLIREYWSDSLGIR